MDYLLSREKPIPVMRFRTIAEDGRSGSKLKVNCYFPPLKGWQITLNLLTRTIQYLTSKKTLARRRLFSYKAYFENLTD